MKRTFHEIRNELNGMTYSSKRLSVVESTLNRTLEALDQLEIDFAILCKEAARSQFNEDREEYDLMSGQFDEMIKRREIELPY